MKKTFLLVVVILLILICLAGCKNFTVTWKNYDGTVLEVDENVKKGDIPQYNGENPTKPSDDDNDYVFSGWSPTISEVTGNQTYIAEFNSIAKTEEESNSPKRPTKPNTIPTPKFSDFVFVDVGQSYFIKTYIGNDKTVEIPSKYKNKPVTALEKWAFSENAVLESVTIPSSIKVIGEDVFRGCEKLASVSIEEGVESMSGHAFAGTALTSITLPNSLTSI